MLVQCSAGLMPTEARGNYLRETKTYHSQPVESIQHAGNFLYSAINTAHFYFFLLKKLCQITSLLTGWKNFSISGAPLEARGPWHLPHLPHGQSGTGCRMSALTPSQTNVADFSSFTVVRCLSEVKLIRVELRFGNGQTEQLGLHGGFYDNRPPWFILYKRVTDIERWAWLQAVAR